MCVFTYYVITWAHRFRDKHDVYTVLCFVFVELTLFSKIFLRSMAMLGMRLNGYSVDEYANRADIKNGDVYLCTYNVSSIISTMLFMIAVLFNSVRWILLTLIQKQVELSRLAIIMLTVMLVIVLALAMFAIVFMSATYCRDIETDEQMELVGFARLLYNSLLEMLNIFCIIVYIYTCYAFNQYYKLQLRQKETLLIDTNDILQMRKSARQIFVFFMFIILIIIIR